MRLFLIFFVLSALFVLSMFYRVSIAVIAPNLIQDLNLHAQTLGILGGAYFYSFTIFQIPMGPMLDRIGPRVMISSFSMIGALGAFLFASGESLSAAFLGRILIGVGMASVLMGSMKVFVLRYPPEKFATLVGIILSVGTLGNIFAASPLAFLTSTIGWRMAFVLAGGITILFAFLVFWILGEKKGTAKGFSPSPPRQELGIFQSMGIILKSLVFWQMAAVAFFRYGTFVGLQGLWLGPYLIDARGYTPLQTGNLLILLAIGTIVGGPIAGRLSDRFSRSRKSVTLAGLGLYSLSLFPLTGVFHIQSSFGYGLIFFSIGFFCSFGMLIYSHAKDLFPVAISGTIMTLVNFFTMAGAAVFMPVLGKIIQSFPSTNQSYPAEAYHLSFLICFLCMTAGVVFYAFSKKENTPSPHHRSEGKVI